MSSLNATLFQRRGNMQSQEVSMGDRFKKGNNLEEQITFKFTEVLPSSKNQKRIWNRGVSVNMLTVKITLKVKIYGKKVGNNRNKL